MDDIQISKAELRKKIRQRLGALEPAELAAKYRTVKERLFEFANFIEAHITLFYVDGPGEVPTGEILREAQAFGKVVILPGFNAPKRSARLMKVNALATDLAPGPRGVLEPRAGRCKAIPVDCIDIAIVPGIAFDEKGGRIGTGAGYYDRLIPRLPATTRKVALALEEQIVSQVQMESHDRFVDIIVTDKRTIYKI